MECLKCPADHQQGRDSSCHGDELRQFFPPREEEHTGAHEDDIAEEKPSPLRHLAVGEEKSSKAKRKRQQGDRRPHEQRRTSLQPPGRLDGPDE